jgi:oligopeptide/dipeptide ABC transporter ATP-binding protein
MASGEGSSEVAPVLTVDHVVKEYRLRGHARRRALRAVDDVTFEIAPGETVGLVGETGCGKTTLGRMVAGLISPTAGRLEVRQAPGAGGAGRPHLVQMVHQHPFQSLDPTMRLASSIGEPIRDLDRTSRRERVADAMRDVALSSELARRYPHELSGGQLQRACIARALIARPRLIVLDEAVSALDLMLQAEILSLLSQLQSRHHIAFLFISHDLRVVEAISGRTIVMYLGRIVEMFPSQDASVTPLHPYSVALYSAALSNVTGAHRPKALLVSDDGVSLPRQGTGCCFADHCPGRKDRCNTETPSLTLQPDGHYVACHYPGSVQPPTDDDQ